MTNLCKDCKWMRWPGEFAECHNPKNLESDKPDCTGFYKPRKSFRWQYCATMRVPSDLFLGWMTNSCGGWWWEPK